MRAGEGGRQGREGGPGRRGGGAERGWGKGAGKVARGSQRHRMFSVKSKRATIPPTEVRHVISHQSICLVVHACIGGPGPATANARQEIVVLKVALPISIKVIWMLNGGVAWSLFVYPEIHQQPIRFEGQGCVVQGRRLPWMGGRAASASLYPICG